MCNQGILAVLARIDYRRKCRQSQQNRKKTTTPAQNIHLSSLALRSIIRIVSPDTPSVFATEYNLHCNVRHRKPSLKFVHVLLLCVLQHLPLRPQVTEHCLSTGNIFIQRRVGVIEKVLFPQRMLLARHITTAHSVARAPAATTRPGPRKHARARPRVVVRVGILRRRSHIRSTAQ